MASRAGLRQRLPPSRCASLPNVAKVAENVKRIGNKSFFRRGDRWVDSSIDEKLEKKAKKIKCFSDEYFQLVDKHGKDVAKYLAFDEPVTLVLDGQVYEFE